MKDVSYKKKKYPSPKPCIEEKLLDNGGDEYDDVDLEGLDDEVTLAKAKKRGHRRVDPSAQNESVPNEEKLFRCSWTNCKKQLESEGLLNAHMAEHRPRIYCNDCDCKFTCEADLKFHRSVNHEEKEWNCDSCSFQARHDEPMETDPVVNQSRKTNINCQICDNIFETIHSLRTHKTNEHSHQVFARSSYKVIACEVMKNAGTKIL